MAAEGREISRSLQVLGLEVGASEDEIKKNYKKLALLHHPDKNSTDPQATQKFQELSEAYTYLMKKEEYEEDNGYSPFEDDVDLLDLLRLFAHLNGHHCGMWAHPSDLWERRSGNVYFDYDNDFYDDDEDEYYQEPPKIKTYSDRYRSSCEHVASESYHHSNTAGAGDNGRHTNSYMSPSAAPEVDKVTKKRRKAAKSRQKQERRGQEVKQQQDKTSETEVGSGECVTAATDSKTKKPSKKQLLAEQKRREKEMAAIAEELQQQCQLAAEKERKRREKEEEKRSVLMQNLGRDEGEGSKKPTAETKAESKQPLGPTKARRKREGKQKRRLARMQNKSKTAEMKESETQPSQSYMAGVTSAVTNSVVSDEEWTEECDRYLDGYTGSSPAASPDKPATPFYQRPAHTATNTFQSSGHAQHAPATNIPKNTVVSSRVIDSVKHNNMFRSTTSAQHMYNDRFASGFCATKPGSHTGDDVVDDTLVTDDVDELSPVGCDDWPEDSAIIARGSSYPISDNLPGGGVTKAGDLSTFTDFTYANGFGDSGTVNNCVIPHQTGFNPVAPPGWSEPVRQPVRVPVRQPVREPVRQPVKNVWQERQQFVSEVLPQSVDEEEEMLRVAIEMSRLQMQEDALRREMWQQEYALQQFQ